MGEPAYNAWRLVSLSPFPGWALAMLGLLLLAGAVLASLGLRREPRAGRRAILAVLRAGAALAALFLLLEPGLRLLQTTRVKNRVAVLVDQSASMAFPASPGGPSRAKEVADFFASAAGDLEKLGDRFAVEYYGFDRDLQPLDPKALATPVKAQGGRTDVLGALRAASSGSGTTAGRKLSGVVVVSDGADNGELAAGVSGKAKEILKELGVPVSTVAVGSSGLKDLAVERVAVDDFAFVRNTVEVEATLRVRGFSAMEVPVVLRREGQVVASRTVQIDPKKDTYQVKLPFSPDQTGHFVYTVSAPVYPDEAIAENNARSFPLKVIRDRVRVLLVAGRPSWDERFLRGRLKQDPNVDLICFFILRSAGDDPHAREDELSLIPFPVNEIFKTQLHTFDLVILQNFAHRDRAYRMESYLPELREYVENGGALAMIGGENSFGEGQYQETPLADVLPVEPTGLPPSPDRFSPRLTSEGRRHPITALGGGGAANAAWASLPPLAGLNVTRAKPGATVLLDHPFLSQGGANSPVVALWEYKQGRVLAVTADTTWYWAFASTASGAPARHFDRFWGNAIRWLVRDPDLTPVTVEADKPGIEPGEPIGATITARLSDYGPAVGAEVDLDLVEADGGKLVSRSHATAGPDGTVRLELPPPPPGPYKLVAKASKNGQPLGTGFDAVAVRAAGPELADTAPRPELLKSIASLTGGSFSELPARGLPELRLVDPEVVEVGRRKDRPIWDRWYYLVALCGFIGGEWVLRRRWGYV